MHRRSFAASLTCAGATRNALHTHPTLLLRPLPRRLYRAVQNLEGYLGCFLANGKPWVPPSGWQLLTM